ncbi:nuclear pore complex protein Nup153 isoform X2 [Mixophyes fleayi]|uniref:nuclear pore complex protein Nup153 isoform X2 n=1 Tax=Mixophyes fleayi TaxID=3061075 RepID=UPI003F4E17ED
MAAEGGGTGTGGKIRSRRYHLSSGRTPYSKNRQQGQQGIISRVTDTVKSIVPAWLQKYFNKADDVPGRSVTIDEVDEQVDTRENDVDRHTQVEEDGPSSADGRVTPEPVRMQEDPSTSRFTLNAPDTLTRPSLHRPNLNFNILGSPALHCQPSTSSTFPIGTTGFSLVKEIKDSTSQHDDDNISTTSGFSSRASEKDIAVVKSVNAPTIWSPEADRTHNLSHNSSMNSKKPTFNLSAFGALSPSLGNTSVLKHSLLGDSPFYPGKTTYGGASAARVSRVRSSPYQAPLIRQVKVKPANAQSYGVTSSTARRILQSLEKMSSPLSDARKIPSVSTPVSLTPENSILGIADNSSKRKKLDSSKPPVQRLVTPQPISISTNMSLYIKPSLTSSSSINIGNRRTQSSDKHKETRGNRVPDAPAPPQPESISYPKFSTPASNGFPSGRGGGKMMREKGSHYTTKPSDEEVEIPDLPEIPLPLSMTALPKISICDPRTTPLTCVAVSKSFSTVGFTFSVPAMKTTCIPSQNNRISARTTPAKSPVVVNYNAEEEQGGFCKPAKTLKEGSVLDILRSPGFSSSSQKAITTTTPIKSTSHTEDRELVIQECSNKAFGIWYCSSCLLENKASDSNCVACRSAKNVRAGVKKRSSTTTPSTPAKSTAPLTSMQGFGDKFKVAPGTWDCDTCLVQNKPESSKCVACETPKPGIGPKAALLLLPTTKSDKPVVLPNSLTSTTSLKFEELARKPIGSWECTVCLVQNKAEDTKCVACTSPKPGTPVKSTSLSTSASATQGKLGLLDQFKPPAGSWDCEVCLVQNKAEAIKCVSCQSAKPGTKAELTGFGTSSLSTESTLPAIKFGLPSSSDSGEIKPNTSTGSSNINASGFSFSKFSGEIKFGTDSSRSADEKKDTSFSFGSGITTNDPVSTTFKFGFNSSAPAEKDSTVKPLTSDFTFGTVPSTASSAPNAKRSGSASVLGQSAKEKSNLTVSFGLKEPEEKKNETPGFTFNKVEQKEPATTFAFGKKDEKTDSTTTGNTVFGSKNEREQPKQFIFSKPEPAKTDASTPASFSFGVPHTTGKKDTDQTAKPAFTFGLPAPAADTGSPKSAFSFQGNASSGATQSSSIGNSGSVFGSVSQPSTQTSSSNVFGSAVQSSTTSVSCGFGTTAPASVPAPSASVPAPSASVPAPSSTVFSSSTSLAAPSGPNNVFGSAASLNTPANSSVLFGNTAVSSTPTSSSSVFGSVAPVNTSSSSNVFGSGAPTSTTASSNSLFGNSSAPTNPSTGPFLFGQPTTTASSSLFGSTNEAKSTFVFSGQESKATVTSTSTAPATVTPFVFGANAPSATPAPPSFNFTSTNTSNVTGTSSTPFIFGVTQAAPAASVLPAATPVPVFGNSASQANAPAFGSSASASLFPASSQTVPAFGSLTSNVQAPPVFGQQSAQPAFGSNTTSSGGSGFPFGNPNFNFSSGNAPGVFTFGSNPAAVQAQPANTGFAFNQPPTFNMGTNARTVPPSISNRKIKTARRRK